MRVDRRTKRTDRAIFAAIQRMSETTPISQMTVTRVAQEADITRKTFYDHFATVTDAYQAMIDLLVEEVAEKTTQDWEALSESGLSMDERSETELRLRFFLGNVRELFEGQLPQSKRRSAFVSHEELTGYLLAPLTKQVEQGLLGSPQRFRGDEELIASFVLAGTLWAYRRGIGKGSVRELDRYQRHACTLLMGGIDSVLNERR